MILGSRRMRQIYLSTTDHNLGTNCYWRSPREVAPESPQGEQTVPPAPKLSNNYANHIWEAIKSRFEGNEESKKMQRNVLKKHKVKNLPLQTNDKYGYRAYDKVPKAHTSKLDVMVLNNKEDTTKVPKKVYENEMKGSSSFTTNSQNLAFLSSENTSSTNDVNTASGDFGVSTAAGTGLSSQVSSTPCADEIDEDDLEEMDLRWQVAMLTDRQKRIHSETEELGLQRENNLRNAPTNDSSSQALVAQDSLGGYD
ncbi:hypothetical protein Tco_1531053 [Tanacetum coccineum]